MWALYGRDVVISVVVNIGPGSPHPLDCQTIAKRFSWGITPSKRNRPLLKPKWSSESKKSASIGRRASSTSRPNKPNNYKLAHDESEIEKNIRNSLQTVYPTDTPPYYRLAPQTSAPGIVQNDTSYPKEASTAAKRYLDNPSVKADMAKISHLMENATAVVTA